MNVSDRHSFVNETFDLSKKGIISSFDYLINNIDVLIVRNSTNTPMKLRNFIVLERERERENFIAILVASACHVPLERRL